MSNTADADGSSRNERTITPTRAGAALAVVGAVLLGIGIFTSTGATVQPRCPDGTRLVARFDAYGSRYRFDGPRGNNDVVRLSATSPTGGRFSSSQPIAAVVVKGGPGSKDTWITPAATSGTFSNDGLSPHSEVNPPISNVQFCVATAVNPATAAAGFDVVTSGDATLTANGSDGPVAIGGNLRFDRYRVAMHSAGTFKVAVTDSQPTALLLGGKFDVKHSTDQLTVDAGWITVANPAGVSAKRSNPNQIVVNKTSARVGDTPRILGQNSSQSLSSATRSTGFDFSGAFRGWKSLAEGLAKCDPTVHLTGVYSNGPNWDGGPGVVDAPGTGQMILRLSADDLARLPSITFREGSEPSAARPLVINVTGVPRNWNPPTFTGDSDAYAPFILWNFGAARSVRISGPDQLTGTALAPSATFDQEGSGNLVGAVYAASFLHGGEGEVHDRPFATGVTPCSCTPPTTTSTVYPTSSTASTTTPTSSTTSTITPTSDPYPTSTTSTSSTSTTPPTSEPYPTSTTSTSSTSTSTSSTTSTSTTSTTAPTTTPTTAPSTTAPSTTEATTSTSEPTTSTTTSESTTTTADVAGTTVVATSITPDDNARVEGTTATNGSGLAFTGSTSLPLVIVGALLLLAGVTTVLVSRRRSRLGATHAGS